MSIDDEDLLIDRIIRELQLKFDLDDVVPRKDFEDLAERVRTLEEDRQLLEQDVERLELALEALQVRNGD